MSCIHFGGSEEAWCNANTAPKLPFTRPESRKSKLERLWLLGTSPVAEIRASAASNPQCPVRLLEVLSQDPSPLVRAWVTRNFKCPRRLLRILAQDIDPGIAAYAMFRLKVLGSFRP